MMMTGDILIETLERVIQLYESRNLKPGHLCSAAVKPGWSVVIGSDSQCGMALNFTGWNNIFGESVLDSDKVRSFVGKSLVRCAEFFLGRESWQERAVGAAALSGLSQPFLRPEELERRGYLVPEDSRDLISLAEPDDIAGIIGYGRWVNSMAGKCREVHVSDLRPRHEFQTLVIGDRVYYTPESITVHRESENREMLSRATLVSITASTLVNGTFQDIMDHTAGARLVAVYGSSGSVIPDVLFEKGVDMLFTYRISDPKRFEEGMLREMNMEPVTQGTQTRLTILSDKHDTQ